MIRLSVAIITFNEERNIQRCLQSVKAVADEVVVLDSFSTDQTVTLAEQAGARVLQHAFDGHIQQKNRALTYTTNDYILSLDADEWLDEEAIRSIQQLKSNWTHAAYALNRLNSYCGQWIRHGAWYPDTKTRLFIKNQGAWTGTNPHDRYEPHEGYTTGKLNGHILHESYRTVDEHRKKAVYFSDIASRAYYQKQKKATLFHAVFSPVFRFLRDYIFKKGFLDGRAGFQIACITASEVKMKYQKLRLLYQSRA